MIPAPLMAQTPPPQAATAKGVQARQTFQKFTVEGQPVDRRTPELDTDHPVFPARLARRITRRSTSWSRPIAEGLDVPWAVEQLPSGRFLITEKAGRLRVLNKDGSALHTITASMPPVYFRGQAGLLDVALDRNFAANHRIFFCYVRIIDADTSALAVDSAVLNEDAGTIANVTISFRRRPSRTAP
jgi:glucose/arabinose dehydrogenase